MMRMTMKMMTTLMIMMLKPYDYVDDTDENNDHKNDSYTAAGAAPGAGAGAGAGSRFSILGCCFLVLASLSWLHGPGWLVLAAWIYQIYNFDLPVTGIIL